MNLLKDTRMRRRLAETGYAALNLLSAARDLPNFVSGLRKTRSIKGQLRKIAATLGAEEGIAPKIFHFVWGFAGAPEPFPFYAYMAIASALHYNPGSKAILHYHHEPFGPHWERIKTDIILNRISDFDYFGIARISHFAHKADIVRLLALNIVGGIYLDCDTLTVKSFEPLRATKVVMGVQAGLYDVPPGLCNATILAPRNSKFIRRWLWRYLTFRSRGFDGNWDYHSVKLPALLSYYHPHEVAVLPFDRFFYPLWSDIDRVMFHDDSAAWLPHLANSFSFHLWRTYSFERLNELEDKFVETSKSVYAHFAFPVIASPA